MAQPKITVNIANGAIGGVPANERGYAAMVVTATTLGSLALNTPKLVFSLKEVEALGVTAAATAFAHRQIKGFYDAYNFITGSEIAPLYIMTVADTVTLANMADKDYVNGLKKLVDFSGGKARLAAIARKPDVGYTPDVTDGVEADSLTALANAQILGNTLAASHKPIRIFVEQRGFLIANVASLEDLATHTENRARGTIGSQLNDGSADVGVELGLAAGSALRRNIGRVRNGNLSFLSAAYVGDTAIESLTAADTIYDKGYGFFRTIQNKNGYFVNDDRMACAKTDDYAYLYRGRTVDEFHRIAHRVYTDWINDDFESIEGGKIAPEVIATLEQDIKRAIKNEMSEDLSRYPDGEYCKVTIDPDQNVVTAGKTIITLRGRVFGHFKDFELNLGFEL